MNNAVYINLSGIADKASLHKILKEAFDFPDYYGGNLDALKDMLTSMEDPRHLVLCGVNDPDPSLRTYIPKLLDVLRDSNEENPVFTYEIRTSPATPNRRAIVVCGSWEDSENLNIFLDKINVPELTSKYVICCFTFGTVAKSGFTKTQVEAKLADLMMRLDPAGIVIFSEMLKSPYLVDHMKELGHKAGIPVFMMEHKHDGCINFEVDYNSGFRDVVKHVIEVHKCRDIMMMAGFKGNPFSEDRINVLEEELISHGMQFDSNKILYGDFWYVPAKKSLQEYLENGGKTPDAIICANDTMAMGTADCLTGMGIRVPEDCIVTGFDGIRDSLYHSPTITTCAPDYRKAAEVICSVLDGWDPDAEPVTKEYTINCKLILKHSCGCNLTTMEEMQEISSTLFRDNQDYFMHVHEMGRLTSQAITISDTKLLSSFLDKHLWLWKDQMFFVGITESETCVNAVYSSWKDIYEYGNKVYNSSFLIPNQSAVPNSDSGINYLIFSQLRSSDESYGYLCTGADVVSLRLQQRFEEMESYISSIVHSVLNNHKLITMNREMKALSELDYMTGLYNRRGFLSRVSKLVREPQNRGKVFNYVTMDLDNLKPINDNYGHQEGDIVIKALAYAIQTRVHKNGISSRYGGDEFAFVMISDESLEDSADRLRNEIEGAAQYDAGLTGKPYKILASIGIASCPISDFHQGRIEATLERLMNIADENMYSDKQIRHRQQKRM